MCCHPCCKERWPLHTGSVRSAEMPWSLLLSDADQGTSLKWKTSYRKGWITAQALTRPAVSEATIACADNAISIAFVMWSPITNQVKKLTAYCHTY